LEGIMHQEKAWSYPAAVRMLMYLAFTMLIPRSSLPCINVPLLPIILPKPQEAVKYICPYLQGIKGKGLTFTPNTNLVLNCYAITDFAGLWKYGDDHQDPICMKSFTVSHGLSTLGRYPIQWSFRLQMKVALRSMTKAKYT
jgi:hypothetical protein